MIETKKFLSKKECNFLINFHNLNYGSDPGTMKWYDLKIIQMLPNVMRIEQFKKILCKLISEARKHSNVYLDYADLVEWDEQNVGMIKHKDYSHQCLSSVIYLNDNYEGGETIVGKKIVKPETGKIIFFNGSKVSHSVNKIIKGKRYTIASWFCKYNND